ncbi:flagellar hook protein FlgE [Phenylobacterium sp.]|uniref:flagellar hook protein FlgE n=1 Tax=Phenylobacterium sp. TaxID=1871053 RepID=UPI0035B064ED
MSINSAMLAGVSGLVANSSSMAAISDNIANLNTTAYKRSQVNFANIVTSQAVKGRYSAGGVQGVTRQYIAQQGLIQSAASSTDLAISGDGFFVVTEKAAGLTNADTRVFTRSGSFSPDADGYLKNDSGFYLQGWPVKDDGTFDTDPSDLTRLQPINVKNLGSAVKATSNVVVTANLNAQGTLSPDLGTYAPTAGNSMADYANDPTTGTAPDFEIEMNVVDSQGGTHRLTIGLIRKDPTTNPNEWYAEVYGDPSEVNASPSGQIAAGTLAFTGDGALDLANSDLFGSLGASPTITLDASGGTAPNWADTLGIKAQTISLNLDQLTQYNSASAVKSVNPDGATVGNVVGVEVDENGYVSAIFDNSEVRQIAKVAIATFRNPDGLQSVSGNSYRSTIQSGEYTIQEPGVAGAGKISPSTLEASTVDLSSEFTGLITTQKAYSACSKIITTADQMLDELINIRR